MGTGRRRHPVRVSALLWPQATSSPELREAALRGDAARRRPRLRAHREGLS